MEKLEKLLGRLEGSEDTAAHSAALKKFLKDNQANFSVEGRPSSKERLCCFLLDKLNPMYPEWPLDLQATALHTLRVLSRDRNWESPMTRRVNLERLVALANLDGAINSKFCDPSKLVPRPDIVVMTEAVKCLCNVVLNNQHLVGMVSDTGLLEGMAHRLSLDLCHWQLPYDLVFYDLRLLLLITACGQMQRYEFRDSHHGLRVLYSIADMVMFGRVLEHSPKKPISPSSPGDRSLASSSSLSSAGDCSLTPTSPDQERVLSPMSSGSAASSPSLGLTSISLPASREDALVLDRPLSEDHMKLMCELLKVLFNLMMDWKQNEDFEEGDLESVRPLTYLLRVLLMSVPAQLSPTAYQMISHVVEVLVTLPSQLAGCLLLPSAVKIFPALRSLYPSLYPNKLVSKHAGKAVVGGVSCEVGVIYALNIDREFDRFNMAAILSVINFMHMRICGPPIRNGLPPVFSALRVLSKGHRSIRRFLRAEILPPLGEVTGRPDSGNSLKSRVVRLMTVGTHGAEQLVAEFLFVLCKESSTRLVKHTGYGNAAGLLMAHGLLDGGDGEGAGNYSDDSGDSDTEEYLECKNRVDMVTGGLEASGPSPLDSMTEEEKEKEAEKLHDLIKKLNDQGIIKMVTMDDSGQPTLSQTNPGKRSGSEKDS